MCQWAGYSLVKARLPNTWLVIDRGVGNYFHNISV